MIDLPARRRRARLRPRPADVVLLAVGPLAMVLAGTRYYTARITAAGDCLDLAEPTAPALTAWHAGVGWAAALLALAGSTAVALGRWAPRHAAPARLAAAASFAMAAAALAVGFAVHPGGHRTVHATFGACRLTAHLGHGPGYWLTVLLVLAALPVSLRRLRVPGGGRAVAAPRPAAAPTSGPRGR